MADPMIHVVWRGEHDGSGEPDFLGAFWTREDAQDLVNVLKRAHAPGRVEIVGVHLKGKREILPVVAPPTDPVPMDWVARAPNAVRQALIDQNGIPPAFNPEETFAERCARLDNERPRKGPLREPADLAKRFSSLDTSQSDTYVAT